MPKSLAIVLIALALAGPAGAQVWTAQTLFRVPVDWAQAPAAQVLAAARPTDANGDAGAVVLCTLSRDGALSGCRTHDPVPSAASGLAALSMAQRYRMASDRAAAIAGMGATVRLAIAWPVAGPPDVAATVMIAAPQSLARYPSAAQVAQAKPRDVPYEGRATLICKVRHDGRLTRCDADEMDADLGRGFGPAALTLAPLFRVRPADARTMAAVDGEVIILVLFEGIAERCLPPYCNTHGGLFGPRGPGPPANPR